MIEIIPIEIELLTQIGEVREKTKMSSSAFGSNACGDPKIIKKLQSGRGITSPTINAIRRYIATYTKADLKK